MYTVFYGKEDFEVKVLQGRLNLSGYEFEFTRVGNSEKDLPLLHNQNLIFYFLKKDDTLSPDFASIIKNKYPQSKVGCLCFADCQYTKEMAVNAGADFFLVLAYPDFLVQIQKNIRVHGSKINFVSHDIKRSSFGLTQEQLLTLYYLASGLSEKKIAELLCVGPEAIKKRKAVIKNKLGISVDAKLYQWAALNMHLAEDISVMLPILKSILKKRKK